MSRGFIDVRVVKLCPPTPEDWDILTFGLKSNAARAATVHEALDTPHERDAWIMLRATLRATGEDWNAAR